MMDNVVSESPEVVAERDTTVESHTIRPPSSGAGRPSRGAVARSGLSFAFDLLLLALIAAGLYFRFSWVNWNQDADIHPDEYGLTSTITRLEISDTLGDYFNTRLSPISPYDRYDLDGNKVADGPDNRMQWGQWPITLIRWTAEATGDTGYGELRLLGRRLSALADSLALVVIFLIGSRLYSRRVGLLAAALSALAVMQIQQSHFMTADTFGVLFTALAMYASVRAAESPSLIRVLPDSEGAARGLGWAPWRWYALFGVFFGMALASRINLLPLFGMILVAAFIGAARIRSSPTAAEGSSRDFIELALDGALRVAMAGVFAFLTFRVTQPMTFRAATGDTTIFTLNPNPDWVESMKVAQSLSSGEVWPYPPGEQWTDRPMLVFPWINLVLWGMGLPLGLTAWAGFAWAAWQAMKEDRPARAAHGASPWHAAMAWQAHLLPLTWAGGYFLFMGTRWVKSVRYFLPIYPFLALFAAWALVELWNRGSGVRGQRPDGGEWSRDEILRPPSRIAVLGPLSFALTTIVLLGTLAWAWGFTSIYRTDNTRIQASRWIYQNVPAPFNLHLETAHSPYTEPLPAPGGVTVAGDQPQVIAFWPRVSGVVTRVTVGHARNLNDPQAPGALRVVLAADPAGRQPLAQAEVRIEPVSDDPRGASYSAPLGPVALEERNTYYLLITAQGRPVQVTGATVSNENWDEGLPLRIEERDGFGGLYQGEVMEVHWQDTEEKRQMLLQNLAKVDYVILPSQRRLWSNSRLPNTYPMTMAYYRALFDGRLGFDLVAEFHSPFRIGPLQVSDIAGTAGWGRPPRVPPPEDSPFNDSPLAAEEAFSVYDHAPVWIFKKRADFDIQRAAAVLNAVDLTKVVNQGPREATRAPTLMMLPADLLAAQRAGGTWREMFNPEGWLNRFQPLGVLAWWLAVLVAGWLAFPLTFAVFGGLSDRGYPLAKSVGLAFVGWVAWILGSLRVAPFTRGTILLAVLLLAAVSGAIYWTRRVEFAAFWRAHRRHILAVEALFLALFVFDLLIRLGNPDLWHPYFGGEKPMDFSYFNAVLKSTYFPPYDPWLAGGYMNYYYYGYVLVGVLVKLLGIVPAFAYNLILPTWFALLGINAFCVAFNLVQGRPLRATAPRDPSAQWVAADEVSSISDSDQVHTGASLTLHTPNAYLAGIAAALFIVVLGNLGQVYNFYTAFQKAADHAALAGSVLGDNDFTAAVSGAWRVLTGQSTLPLSQGDQYWVATRIIGHVAGEGNEITEFPFFTFLYADLHANMMALPFAVLALAWAASYLLDYDRPRTRAESAALWLMGGLIFGMSRPTHTWDYPVYLALGAVAVVAAHGLRAPGATWEARLTRATLWAIGWRVLLLVALSVVFYRPYDQWYVTGYTEAELWDGLKTPLSAYFYIHGLSLFVLVTFLVWETRRWLAETPATILSRAGDWVWPVLSVLFLLLAAVTLFWMRDIVIGLVALPLMLWAGLLLLRSMPNMALEKRVVLFLLGTGLAITLVVELFTLKGDIGRMNTIFKFYLQVWTIFSVAAAAALAWVWAALPGWKSSWRGAWTGALSLLVAAAALYTFTAAAAKIRDRFPPRAAGEAGCAPIPGLALPYAQGLRVAQQPHSLDGLDYMKWSAYCDPTNGAFLPLAYDQDAIRWLQDHVPGSPVIAEAHTVEYQMGSRYAWNTGLPDVVGWNFHQRQQRAAIPTDFIWQRIAEVSNFYSTPDLQAARDFLAKYDVRYVVVGPLERAYFGAGGGLDKFDVLLSQGRLALVYQNPGVQIYEVQ